MPTERVTKRMAIPLWLSGNGILRESDMKGQETYDCLRIAESQDMLGF